MKAKRTKPREIDTRRLADDGEVRWLLVPDGTHIVTILDARARVIAALTFAEGHEARDDAFDHPALYVAPAPAIPTEPKHEPEPSRASEIRISGKYAVFTCERAHEWAGELPSFYSDAWPRCPTCGKPAYLREPGWHRVHD